MSFFAGKKSSPAALEVEDRAAYRKVTEALGRKRKGATAADITAATALPLSQVRELLPVAADEFQGRLEVTESGEICYSFPRGFVSRYRGFRAGLRRFTGKLLSFLGRAASFAFKVWIMVMLIGYFALFLAIALLSIFVSIAGNSRDSGNRRGGGLDMSAGIFSLIWRLWFYSELTRSMDRRYGMDHSGRKPGRKEAPSRPMHRAIFSFVFGEENPNKNQTVIEKKTVIAYIQAHRGVISLPEFMSLTGKSGNEAEEALMACCAEFGGSPEATEEGTLVYRFDPLLLRSENRDRSFADRDLSPPLERLKKFSDNSKTMNIWFAVINTVNLLFGSYFLYNTVTTGIIAGQEQFTSASFLYRITYLLGSGVTSDPPALIGIGLGLVPLVFSALFWLIPALRYRREQKENETIKLRNLKRLGFGKIWSKPLAVESGEIESQAAECRPKKTAAAQDRVIKEMGAYSVPEVEINAQGTAVYSFKDLDREKQALEQYRAGINPQDAVLGNVVFDSDSQEGR